MEISVKKNDEYDVEIIDYGANGEGIAKINNFTIFINNAIKGEKCKIHIVKVLTSYGYGKIVEIIEKSSKRKEPDCTKFGMCGGCDLRHIEYNEILKIKQEKVQNLVSKTLNNNIIVNKTIGADKPLYYRNKAIYPVSEDRKIGFYKKRTHDIVPINNTEEKCKIHSELSQKVSQYALELFKGEIYNSETGKGILRNIMTREGFATGELMLVIVQTTDKVLTDVESLVEKYPMVKTIIININNKNTNVVLSKENKVIYGDGYILDKLGEYKFKISPNSFYQVNPLQTEKIYKYAIEKANLTKQDILCDLYCGIGTIGILASKHVKKVYGIEIVPEAIIDAKENSKMNNINNIEFIQGDVENAFEELLKNKIKPDVVIVDPPRKGLDKKTITNLKNLRLNRVVYISCNPATLVRDLKELENIYEIVEIQPFDNFCYTSHVEVVAVLKLMK